MKTIFKILGQKFQIKLNYINKIIRGHSIDLLIWETEELENIFALLTFGSFIGLPAAPTHLALNLLPEMERELIVLLDKVPMAAGPISDLFSKLDIG
jgi:hypothetical protein